ncbi:MAG TPA: glycine--tRNA ligase subunit beta [bacterium]|nr:glycine--tRNA ligase subunit beta [bacterium]
MYLTKDAILEIGCEELPSSYIRPAIDQMVAAAEASLKEHKISYQYLYTYYTPRRLALFFKGLPEMQQEIMKEVTGPPVSVAFDEHGLPTRAGEGFAKAQGVSAASLKRMMTPKGEVVVAHKKSGGRMTSEIMAEVFPEVIKKIRFPKVQRWGNGDFLFARPIRWVCSVYSRSVIPFGIAGLYSSRETRGLRALKQGPLDVVEAGDYLDVLRSAGVVAAPDERRQTIWNKVQQAAAERNTTVIADPELLDDVNNLIEAPDVIMGSFDPQYLTLPEQVIVTAMREHQKYFAVRDAQGNLAPYFIGVINGTPRDKAVVIRSNEAVLKARLEDAKFFVAEDLKLPLEGWAEKVAGITWLEGMGTMADKAERLSGLVKKLGPLCGIPKEKVETAAQAALLCKADLATNIIREKEFNSLQGVMGGLYAAQQGKPEVGEAVQFHYFPRFSGDKLPPAGASSLLSMADKLDTIVGCFLAGVIPTGSQDPFALRRQALGIMQILLESRLKVSLDDLVTTTQKQFGGKVSSKVTAQILDFFNGRLQTILEGRGLVYDVINASTATAAPTLIEMIAKAETIQKLKMDPDFQKLATAAGRVLRILPPKKVTAKVSKPLLKMEEERDLFDKVQFAQKLVADTDPHAESYYEDLIGHLETLIQPIHAFFEKVMVMDKNVKVRNNRLALLQQAAELFLRVCDFRKLVYASENAASPGSNPKS